MQNDFNKIAPVYDFLAGLVFGKSIKHSQWWLLDFVPRNSRVLIIGGGTGWILEAFLANTNCKSILYLEASEKMLALSRKRYEKLPKTTACHVEFRMGTEAALGPPETFDIIFTGYVLDLFQPQPLNLLMNRLNKALHSNGLWLLADFSLENGTTFIQKLLLKSMIVFFKLTANLQADKIQELKPIFESFDLKQIAERYFYSGLIRSAVYKKQ